MLKIQKKKNALLLVLVPVGPIVTKQNRSACNSSSFGMFRGIKQRAIHDVASFMVEAKEKIQLIEHINLLTLSQHIPLDSLQCRPESFLAARVA